MKAQSTPQGRKKSKEPSRSLFKSITYSSGALLLDGVNAVTPHWAGAVDVVAVRQPDGTLKSSPFYVRFGKFQSIIRYNRHVRIEVNGTVVPFTMHLGSYGQAYFIREIEELCSDDSEDEALAGMISPASTYDSGDDSYFKQLQSPVQSGLLETAGDSLTASAPPLGTSLSAEASSSLHAEVTSLPTPAAPPPPALDWRSVDRSSKPSAPSGQKMQSHATNSTASMVPLPSSPFVTSQGTRGTDTHSSASLPEVAQNGLERNGTASGGSPANGLDASGSVGSVNGAEPKQPSPMPPQIAAEPLVVVGFGVREVQTTAALRSTSTQRSSATQTALPTAPVGHGNSVCVRLHPVEDPPRVRVEVSAAAPLDGGARGEAGPCWDAFDSGAATAATSEEVFVEITPSQRVTGSQYFSSELTLSMARPTASSLLSTSMSGAKPADAAAAAAAASTQDAQATPPRAAATRSAQGAASPVANGVSSPERRTDAAEAPTSTAPRAVSRLRTQPKPFAPDRVSSPDRRYYGDAQDSGSLPAGSSPGNLSKMSGALAAADLLRTFALSLCADLLLNGSEMTPAQVAEVFAAKQVTADMYNSDAQSVLCDPNLVIRVEDRVYRYADALSLIFGLLAFRDSNTWQRLQPKEWWQTTLPQDGKPQTKRSWWPFFRSANSDAVNSSKQVASRQANEISAFQSGSSPATSPPGLYSQSELAPLKLLKPSVVDLVGGSDDDRPMRKRKVVTKTSQPTAEQLAMMAEFLVPGRNSISFVIGGQRVTSLVYLFEWNIRLVISDIDGTITRSDVLGHVLPPLGLDWSHAGIVRLFSDIFTNGYSFVFLSSRSIAQSGITRNFLNSLKQDVHSMPDGPVIISPHGIIPSLYREMILKRPQEFKIAALQAIRDLFPEEWNPFYAGFGNRDTDEISYLEVGVPASRIFTINPKGMVKQQTAPVQSGTFDSLAKINDQVDLLFPVTQLGRLASKSIGGELAGHRGTQLTESVAANLVDVDEREEFNDTHFWRIPDVELCSDDLDAANDTIGTPVLGLEQRYGKPATTSAVGGPVLGASVSGAAAPLRRVSEKDAPRCVNDLDKFVSLVERESGGKEDANNEDMASCSSSADENADGGKENGKPAPIEEDEDVFDDAEEVLVYSPYSPM